MHALYSREMYIVIVSITEVYKQQTKRKDKICKNKGTKNIK